MWYPAKVTAPPTAEPISVDDAKRQCRILIEETEFNAELERLCKAARDHIEAYCGMRFAEWPIMLECDGFADFAAFPEAPLKSISTIVYFDEDGGEQILGDGVYEVGGSRFEPAIILKDGPSWPKTAKGSRLVVSAVLGGDVPESVAHAMLIFVADSFNQRENAKADNWTVLDVLLCNHRRGTV